MQRLSRLPRLIAREFQTRQSRQKFRKDNPRFHSRQRGSETGMDTVPEGNMRIRIARDVESVRIAELPGIAICGADHRQHELPRWDDLAVHFRVASRRPHQPLERRAISQDFLDRRRQKVWHCAQAGELLRIFDETQNGVVDQIRRGFLAANDQQLEESQDLSPC
jgi:hypothetical protein